MKNILIISILLISLNIFSQPVNGNLIQSGSTVSVYLIPTATESRTLGALNLTFNLPSGVTIGSIGSNLYALGLDTGLSPTSYTTATGSNGSSINWVSGMPHLVFSFTITGPSEPGVTLSDSGVDYFYVQLGAQDRTGSINNSPLPITLSTFSAIQHSDRSSKLDWTTSSEINSDYFGIERSRDGDIWETIGKVTAAGNSNTELAYEYIDNLLPFSRTADQIFYYRLRLTDQDGSFKYSDIKGVNFNRQTADGVIAVYPNPATQMVHIDVVGMDESQGETKLRIFDMFGRVMLDKAILGSGLEPVDVLQYPSGVYNISVTQGDKLHQKQFIKVE